VDGINLAGTVVLVTGATGDMGSAFAQAIAAAGADLVLTSRSADRLEQLADAITDSTGRRVRCLTCDLSDRAAAGKLGLDSWDQFGRIDGVVNNAVPPGSQEMIGDLLTTPDDAWQQFLDPIVFGPLSIARAIVPRMAAAGGGAFVNIVSATGIAPTPGFDAYGFAKGGLILLTKYMAREWGAWNIRANAVSPGLIMNPLAVASGNAITRRTGLLERTALGRKGHKEEIVGAVTFLLSPAASYISGETLSINGGRF
jgi:NAD(P)-dependent dehydrogenase (short-subunit alcohol dehydrogenase family)